MRVPLSLNLHQYLLFSFCFVYCHPSVCEGDLMFSFPPPYWLRRLSIFSCACWLFVYLLWRNAYLSPLPIYKLFINWVVCLYYWVVCIYHIHSLYILYIVCVRERETEKALKILLPWKWRKRPWAKQCRQLLETGRGNETDSPLAPMEGTQPRGLRYFNVMRPVLDLWPLEL